LWFVVDAFILCLELHPHTLSLALALALALSSYSKPKLKLQTTSTNYSIIIINIIINIIMEPSFPSRRRIRPRPVSSSSSSSLLVLSLSLFVVVIDARPPMMLFNELLQRFHKTYPDFEPNAIVDIGANKGEWTKTAVRLFPNAKFLMIEASPMHNETLYNVTRDLQSKALQTNKKKQFDYEIAVLSDTDRKPVSFFQDGDTGNSMFQEKSHYYDGHVPITRMARTLDALLQESFLRDERVDIIKADVQGAELVVFRGATNLLKRRQGVGTTTTLLQFEGSTVRYNEGGSCTHDVDAFLRDQGYFLYDVGGQVYDRNLFRTGGLGQYDGTCVCICMICVLL
jgi:FkbM family methyltransferase